MFRYDFLNTKIHSLITFLFGDIDFLSLHKLGTLHFLSLLFLLIDIFPLNCKNVLFKYISMYVIWIKSSISMTLWLHPKIWTCLLWCSSHCPSLFYSSCFLHENYAKNMNNICNLVAVSMLNCHCLQLCYLQNVQGLIWLSSTVVHKVIFNEMWHEQKCWL